jgi:hypothetical protein
MSVAFPGAPDCPNFAPSLTVRAGAPEMKLPETARKRFREALYNASAMLLSLAF